MIKSTWKQKLGHFLNQQDLDTKKPARKQEKKNIEIMKKENYVVFNQIFKNNNLKNKCNIYIYIYIYIYIIFSFEYACLNSTDTSFLPILSLFHSSFRMSYIISGWKEFKKAPYFSQVLLVPAGAIFGGTNSETTKKTMTIYISSCNAHGNTSSNHIQCC